MKTTNIKRVMKHYCFILLLPAIFSIFVSAGMEAQKPKFNGKWVININKSTLGDIPLNVTQTFIITEGYDSITLKRIGIVKKEDSLTTIETLPLNGNSIQHFVNNGIKKTASVSFSSQENVMTEIADYFDDNPKTDHPNYRLTQVFTLLNDSTLQVKSVIMVKSENEPTKIGTIGIYEKQ